MKKFYVGVKGLIKSEKGYLLIKHAKGHYEIPGGRIDDGEDFVQTIKRELDEELPGAKNVELGKLLGASRVHKDIDNDVSLVLLYFEVSASLPDDIVVGDDHVSYLWVNSAEDLPDGLFPEFEEVLRKTLSN